MPYGVHERLRSHRGVNLTGKPRDLAFAYHHYRTNWKGCQGAMSPWGRSVPSNLELVQAKNCSNVFCMDTEEGATISLLLLVPVTDFVFRDVSSR